MKLPLPPLDRRTLLIGGGTGVGLVVAYALWPRRHGSALRAAPGEQVFGHWLKIGSDGRVTAVVPQVEAGQGSWTGLAQILADELGAAWDQVAVEPAPASPFYANPLAEEDGWTAGAGRWRRHQLANSGLLRVTAGATSIRAFEPVLRRAGATGRALLVAAAARRWGVDPAECDTVASQVVHEGKALAFGELAAAAADETAPTDPPLRPPPGGRLIGRPLPRLDLPGKSDGSARLAADVRLPGLLFASVRLAPPDGRLAGYSRRPLAGDVALVARDEWLAAVASSWWTAEQALAGARPRFTGAADAGAQQVAEALDRALESGEPTLLADRGDIAGLLAGVTPFTARYRVAPAAHHGLETLTATARFAGDRLEVWAPTQAPEFARAAAAHAAGMAVNRVTLYPMPVGGGGGRALEADAVPLAVQLAAHVRRPVQLVFPAGHAQNHDPLRPPAVARLQALPGADSTIALWNARIAFAAGEAAAFARLDGRAPPTGGGDLAGAVPPYAVPVLRTAAVPVRLPIRTGYLRGGAHGLTAFFTESFVDEVARSIGAEPLALRMAMLGDEVRLARAIASAAALGGWDGGGPGSTVGLACHSAFGSHIGLLAQATVASDQRIAVSRLVAVVDCGQVINRSLVRQQIEGGLLAALALATSPAPSIVAGMPQSRPLGAFAMPRLAGVPTIAVDILASDAPPGGVSGLAEAVLAPAVANAIHAATGRRLRTLPFDAGASA